MTALADAPPREAPAGTHLGRAAAVLSIGSATVHLLLVDPTDLGSLAMVALAMVCLPCARHLWRSPTANVWALTATLDAAMLVVHAQMSIAPAHHSHSGPAPLTWLGLGIVTVQLLLAGVAALRR